MSDLNENIELAVSAEGAGARLDTYAASAAELSRNAVQRMIEEGEILLNGRRRIQTHLLPFKHLSANGGDFFSRHFNGKNIRLFPLRQRRC